MGLDMYLLAHKYVEKIDWNKVRDLDIDMDSPEAVIPQFNEVVSIAGLADVAKDIYGARVQVTAAYWRKANMIHAWFVENVQKGIDDCGDYYVSQAKLKELYDSVVLALAKRDPSYFPPQEGFFFGSTDIDEWYWRSLENTKAQLERIFALPNLSELSFSYNSSW